MLAVEAVRDELTSRVKLIDHPVCILLHTSCENDYLVVLGHLTKELCAVRSDQEVRLASTVIALIDVMDQRLVKVENESVFAGSCESVISAQ